MSVRFLCRLLCVCAMGFLLLSCEHRPLEDPANAHYLRVYLDENLRNVTFGFYNPQYERPHYSTPRVMRAVLADPHTGRVVAERYLQNQGTDEKGYYIEGYINAPPGTYNLLVYSYGAPYTMVRNENDYYTMQAYTNRASDYYHKYMPELMQRIDAGTIRQQPDHMFHEMMENIVIVRNQGVDTLRNAKGEHFTARSMVRSYYIQLRVKGIEWARSAVSVLSGMAGSSYMHRYDGMAPSDPAYVLFSLKQASRSRSSDGESTTAVLYTTFSTFGKLAEERNMLTVTFEFSKVDGTTQVEQVDITDMFATPMVRDNQWILLEHEVEIAPPDDSVIGGGMTPGVDDWTDIESDIFL